MGKCLIEKGAAPRQLVPDGQEFSFEQVSLDPGRHTASQLTRIYSSGVGMARTLGKKRPYVYYLYRRSYLHW